MLTKNNNLDGWRLSSGRSYDSLTQNSNFQNNWWKHIRIKTMVDGGIMTISLYSYLDSDIKKKQTLCHRIHCFIGSTTHFMWHKNSL